MLPYLFYNTQIPLSILNIDRPYRNAGDLLVNACPSVKNALRLCGAEERILDGDGSDFERFTALCYSMPYLVSHPVHAGVTRLMRDVFMIYEELSPYNCEEMWNVINEYIESNELTPTSLLSILNVESVCCRVDPLSSETARIDGVDIYTVSDLARIVDIISSINNSYKTLSEFINAVSDLSTHSALRIELDKHYFYVRNSKKVELEGFYSALINNESLDSQKINALVTYVTLEVIRKLNKNDKPLILNAYCDESELDNLFSYLSLNNIKPNSTLLISRTSSDYINFINKHTTRNPYGMPSIVLSSSDYNALGKSFPIGLSVQSQENITDVVSLSATISNIDELTASYGEDITENMTYMNIKNIFHI